MDSASTATKTSPRTGRNGGMGLHNQLRPQARKLIAQLVKVEEHK